MPAPVNAGSDTGQGLTLSSVFCGYNKILEAESFTVIRGLLGLWV